MSNSSLSQNIWKQYGFEKNPFSPHALSLESNALPLSRLFVGRSQDSSESRLITNILRSAGGGRFVIEGEIGVGKTTFLNYHRYLWYATAQDKLFTPLCEIPVSPDWTVKDFLINILDALLNRLYIEKGEAFLQRDPLLLEISLLTKVYIQSQLNFQASAYGFGVAFSKGKEQIHIPNVAEYGLAEYFRQMVQKIKELGYAGIFLHFDNLELVSLKYPEKIREVFEKIRDSLQIEDVYYAFVGNRGFFTDIISPLERVRSIFFGFPIQLPCLSVEEVIQAIELRYKVLSLHGSFIRPFENEFIEYLYHLYRGKVRFIMDGLHTIILHLPSTSPLTLSMDQAKKILEGIVEDKIEGSLTKKEKELLQTLLKYDFFTNTQIGKELRMTAQSISNYMNKFMELGFVYIAKKDGRKRFYQVSETLKILKNRKRKKSLIDGTFLEPTPRQKAIVEYLKFHTTATTKDLKKHLQCSSATALRDLNVLICRKYVFRKGSTRNAYYCLASKI